MTAATLFATQALLPTGWASNVLLAWNAQGTLITVHPDTPHPPGIPAAQGPVIPGLPNLHSHAFQRAFAGLAEYRASGQDSFWSWRALMYRFAARITPAQLEAIATWLYVEMLEAGFTSVCEFHYLHHDADGRPYADDATLALCLLRAAQAAGIGLTLLPVLYQASGFGAQPPRDGQRRFIRGTQDMLRLLERLRPACAAQGARLGLAPHSLRAVPPGALSQALAGLAAQDATAPVHIHIAEQTQEVDDCIAWSGQRPVEWLLEHAPVDARWCLVHATHMTAAEYARAAATGAVAGLCPSTEANLGDGLFELPAWRDAGGAWGVGSDSHASVNAAQELMLLEYGQRLRLRQRNVLAAPGQPDVATAMTLQAMRGGAQAAGRAVAGLAVGQQADFVALDARHVALQGLSAPQQMLAAHVFASHRTSAVAGVWSRGVQCVAEGRHALHAQAARAFIDARRALL
ncbi:formimidoylglutamate deiminase [Ramlibacter sp. H39-3-26]|uniref:formimidoylglutamate deiminase n=1 Tax=Curvibacter soli TaxID=3031331 RepID=UPI0023D9EA03|nr:formimidoylglutamate deiminase [Ramlibacter sp. H39-3-26]MDF1486499.1 formimidoylglutamate deiminase [Ramlibacter sp. H39-3-26]